MDAFYNRILKINLTSRTFSAESVSPDILETYLGGKGLGAYLLHRNNPQGIDPLSEDNRLIFTTGPSTGSSIWGSCRYGVFTKSPQTGYFAESYSGGRVPEAMDAAGYDGIVIRGKADSPTALSITPDGVTFASADPLWGLDTYETEDSVKKLFDPDGNAFKKSGAVVIGPAGENLVRFAVIENDYWRSAGRAGVGTVMGSKKIKAILFQGDRKRNAYDEKGMKRFTKEFVKKFRHAEGVQNYKTKGTPMMVKLLNKFNSFPTRYWNEGYCEHWQKIDADALHEKCSVTPNACLKCFMACGRKSTVKSGRHAGLTIEGPEYETIYAFGGLCMIDRIEEIVYLNDICDRLGMDTITAGNLCALAIEAKLRKKIDYPVAYGNADNVADLLNDIARCRDIGAVLARGIIFAAKEWGLEDIAVHVKGMEPAGYDPRVLKGMGLAYATSDRGACHLRTTFYKPELSGQIAPDQIENKAELFIDFEDRMTLFDTMILCRFYRDFYPWDRLSQLVRITTGLDADKQMLAEIASNISNLIRHLNIREGLSAHDDFLPPRFFQKMKHTDYRITREELRYMISDYYRLRGWDENGRPL